MIEYKFRERELLAELQNYIDKTYSQHYNKGNIQSLEAIDSSGNSIGFVIGDIIKYAMRYRHKYDTPDKWRSDLMKIAHYSILALWCHDKEYSNASEGLDHGGPLELLVDKPEPDSQEERVPADQ